MAHSPAPSHKLSATNFDFEQSTSPRSRLSAGHFSDRDKGSAVLCNVEVEQWTAQPLWGGLSAYLKTVDSDTVWYDT